MCGIAGFLTQQTCTNDNLRMQALKMSDAISHRGPDGDGAWCDSNAGIALSHRRLSIVDLSPTGAQPMTSSCGKLVMVYNGEVYNAEKLKSELASNGTNFRGTSDSEVILEGFAQWGIENTVQRLIGMFAIAIWNRETKRLTLVRDRLGIKPVYWSYHRNTFLFGSELKALRQHPDCPTALDHQAISSYLRKSYINAPKTIFENIQKLQPGSILTFSINKEPSVTQYWSLHDTAIQGSLNQDKRNDAELVTELEELLTDAVKMRMIADVPLGAFLSGGIDSSTIAALMQTQSSSPIRTFSIGFEEDSYNEAPHAAAVAKHLGTDHHDLYVTSDDALDVIPKLHTMYDEPFADMSQIPTYLISKLTREHVTVALSGDGGDELFAGYERYFTAAKYHQILNQPESIRKLQASALDAISPAILNKISHCLPNNIGKLLRGKNLKKVPGLLRDGNSLSLYQSLIWHLEDTNSSLTNQVLSPDLVWEQAHQQNFTDKYSLMQYVDSQDYLPDDILTKVDRASMASSLEARVPMIDHRVVEFAWKLPERMKVRNGKGKWILRQVLSRHVPQQLIDRPKMGFGVPIDSWLRGPLKDWAETLLSEQALKETGIFNASTIRRRWSEHQNGTWNWQFHLWDVLMMQSWLTNSELR